MSTFLLDQTVDFVRSKFTRQQVLQVEPYGGEFSASEIPFKSYSCPAIFVTVLGWSPKASGQRVAGRGVRSVSMAAFVVFKHVDRKKRLAGAMALAEQLSIALSSWNPATVDAPIQVMPVDADPVAENLYGRAVDKVGQALWMVRWTQDLKVNVPPGQLFDLLAVHIDENYHPGQVPGTTNPVNPPLTVTDAITFPQEP
ncbi:hypothetical protein [Variovorax paradoxus]|uniref:DUF1834 family protein n=1 Tax=Variovorax paradoxus TaxID=34073 RepID=A0A0H2M1V4_VARPD|nr:hypothetical protein [Variovorax paradoxus]KLN54727.1 hypothetical protein VPARA_40310 [Variovorax paradoxus]